MAFSESEKSEIRSIASLMKIQAGWMESLVRTEGVSDDYLEDRISSFRKDLGKFRRQLLGIQLHMGLRR